ncbi:PDxFFG protein [[Mycoplasma] collis]|uniref:PDxFFG protein n=1 Tax=[Mycoplasma] collis TaxID=2127 RepID=UPI00051C70F5|nr:PDxFFG protein [[Mycoplasma] collis]
MKKLKKISDLSLKSKLLLSVGTISAAAAISISSLVVYANNSDEVNGVKYPNNDLSNDFSSIFDENNNVIAEVYVLDPLKNEKVALLNSEATEFWFIKEPEKKYNFDDFFKKYFEIYNEEFILEVKYGSFSFFNEYVLAVKPSEFIKFTKWFIENIAWGPDLITLDNFSLVKGVKLEGNNVTLGSHTTLKKEQSKIEFYPDAFFGSLPIYSNLSGPNNSNERLSSKLFEESESKETIDNFLKTISISSAIANSSNFNNSYLGIYIPKKLVNKKLYVVKNTENNESLILDFEKKPTLQEFNQYIKKHNLNLNNFNFNNIKKYEISKSSALKNTGSAPSIFLRLDLNELDEIKNDKKIEKNSSSILLDEKIFTSESLINYEILKKLHDKEIQNFLDFYDVKEHIGKKITYYSSNSKEWFYKNKIEALNLNKELKDYSKLSKETKDAILEYTIKDIFVSEAKLTIILEDKNKKEKTLIFDAKNMSETDEDKFDSFKSAIEYLGALNPVAISFGPEEKNAKNKFGDTLKGLDSRSYNVYVEKFSGLIEKVSKKFPHILRKKTGPHLVKKINDLGYYEYEIQEGEYNGFQPDDRIGLALILATYDENFDGFSFDFLKYVSAHEYGHHFTLDQIKNLNETQNSLIVGAISTRGGLSDDSFYSKYALKNYLDARTNLDFINVNALGQETENNAGSFIRFKYLNKDGEWVTEKVEDIWGSAKKPAKIEDIIANKKRRFLQTFDTLKKAAELRKVKVSDLFLANSFDENSGTLNPTIGGKNKIIEKYTDNNKQVKKRWVDVTTKNILEKLTTNYLDDNGEIKERSLIDAGAVIFTDENNYTFEIVEINDENKAVKIKLFNRDGTPVINVPLNEELSDEELEYIENETNKYKQILNEIIVKTWSHNGWDSPSTFLGGESKFSIRTLDRSSSYRISKDYNNSNFSYEIVSRLKNNNLTYDVNVIGTNGGSLFPIGNIDPSSVNNYYYAPFNKNKDTNKNGLLKNAILINKTATTLHNSYINGNFNFNESVKIYSDAGKVFAFLEKDNSNSKFEIKEKFTFPFSETSKFLNDLHTKHEFESIIRNLARTSGAELGYFQNSIIYEMNESFLSKNGIFKFLNKENELFNYQEFANKLSTISATDLNKITELEKEYNDKIAKIVLYNYNNNFNNKFKFYDSFKKGYKLKIKNEQNYSLVFETLNDLLNFASLDYSKAKVENVEYTPKGEKYIVNWDLDYVKTKFDLEEFKKQVLNQSNESEKIKEYAKSNNDQLIANELMLRLRNSDLFLSIKDFNPVKELVKNKAFFTRDYGIQFKNSDLASRFIFDEKNIDNNNLKNFWSIEKLQKALEEFIKKQIPEHLSFINGLTTFAVGKSKEEITEIVLSLMDTQDLYKFLGNILNFDDLTDDIYVSELTTGLPSKDFITYADTRVEDQVADKFTDYIYNIAETLTRDYVQTTYVAEEKEFSHLSTFIKGLNEEATSLDYVTDGTKLDNLNNKFIDLLSYVSPINNAIKSLKSEEYIKKTSVQLLDKNHQLRKLIIIKDELEKKINNEVIELTKKTELLKEIEKLNNEITKLNNESFEISQKFLSEVLDTYSKNDIFNFNGSDAENSNAYFGKFISKSNGFALDRHLKQVIDMHFYDDDLNEIHDDSIRIQGLEDANGNRKKITSRPEAFFTSQLLNYGAGRGRNISGIFRRKEKDALSLYGFLPLEQANKIKYIKFSDLTDKQNAPTFIKFNTKKTNNLFYLKRQSDPNSKVRIEDLGYTSWLSDFAIMGKYRDAHLKPNHKYLIEFVDENHNFVTKATLGELNSVTENGKLTEQAPIQIFKDETENNDVVIQIKFQFRVTN